MFTLVTRCHRTTINASQSHPLLRSASGHNEAPDYQGALLGPLTQLIYDKRWLIEYGCCDSSVGNARDSRSLRPGIDPYPCLRYFFALRNSARLLFTVYPTFFVGVQMLFTFLRVKSFLKLH